MHPRPGDIALVERVQLPDGLHGEVHRGLEHDEPDVHRTGAEGHDGGRGVEGRRWGGRRRGDVLI